MPLARYRRAAALLRRPWPELLVSVGFLGWFLWPVLTVPAVWLRVTRERLGDFDSDLVPYVAIQRDLGALFWNPWAGFGRPAAGDPLVNFFDPLAFFWLVVVPPLRGIAPLLFCSFLLAALVAWLLGRELGLGRIARLGAALGFATSGFALAHLYAGHLEFLLALPALPLAWLGGRRLTDGRSGGVFLTALALALPVLAGGAYFAELGALILLAVLLMAAPRLVRRRAFSGLLVRLALAALAAVGLSAIHLLPVLAAQPVIVRAPVDPYSGSQLLFGTMRNWLATPAFYQRPDAGPLLEGRAHLSFDWWESDAYVGPLALLLAAGGIAIGLAGQRQRRTAGEALLIVALALCWVAAAVWSPFHYLLPHIPAALQLRIVSRPLGDTTLALFVLAGLALDALARLRPRLAPGLAALLAIGSLAFLAATGRPLLVQQARATAELAGPFPLLPAPFRDVAIGPTVPQTPLVQQGVVVVNDYHGWQTPAKEHPKQVNAVIDAWLVRLGVGLAPSTGPGPPLPAANSSGPPGRQVLLLPQEPGGSHVRALCAGAPCRPAPAIDWQPGAGRARLCTRAGTAARYVLPLTAAPGWAAERAGSAARLDNAAGLLSLDLPAGAGCVQLRYRPPGFAPGAALTALTLLALAGTHWRRVRWLPKLRMLVGWARSRLPLRR